MPRQRREIPWLHVLDGTYYVYWYEQAKGRTKRISLQTKNPLEAQKRYADFLANGQEVFDESRQAVGLSVSHALDDYYREHVAEKVIDKKRQEDCIAHLKAWFKTDAFSDVDITATRAYRDARRAGTVGGGKRRPDGRGSDSTIRRELVTLQAAANHAAAWKRIGPNASPPSAMPSIELPSEFVAGAIEEDEWLTQAELARILATATGRLLDFIIIGYYTAGRRRSIERLTRFQVNLERGQIDLRRPDETVLQRNSKKRRPKVPIDAAMRPTIERLLAEGSASVGWLFGDEKSMYRPFRDHLAGLGLATKARPHVLRHSRATHLLQAGKSLWDVAKLLGDTVATVERVYGHHCADHLAEVVREEA